MQLKNITGVANTLPQVDIEELSRHNPNPTNQAPVAGNPYRNNKMVLREAGERSRADLSGALVRAQLAGAASSSATDLTNSRFAGEPSLEAVLQGSPLPRTGEGAKRVQQALIDLGFAVKGGADGVFGMGSRLALQQFQREQG